MAQLIVAAAKVQFLSLPLSICISQGLFGDWFPIHKMKIMMVVLLKIKSIEVKHYK